MSKPTDNGVAEFMRDLAAGARADLIPKMRGSLFCLTLLDGEPDIKLALEVGMALVLDKPLIIIAVGDTWISPRLRQVAHAVVEGPRLDEDMKQRITVVLRQFMENRETRQ